MNAGHHATHEGLALDGVVTGRVWSSIVDRTTRETHIAADGQKVKAGANFLIGGNEARYPGNVELPAEERVRCRCVVTGKI
jgi:uncharacterized protein with gpF-like domain